MKKTKFVTKFAVNDQNEVSMQAIWQQLLQQSGNSWLRTQEKSILYSESLNPTINNESSWTKIPIDYHIQLIHNKNKNHVCVWIQTNAFSKELKDIIDKNTNTTNDDDEEKAYLIPAIANTAANVRKNIIIIEVLLVLITIACIIIGSLWIENIFAKIFFIVLLSIILISVCGFHFCLLDSLVVSLRKND